MPLRHLVEQEVCIANEPMITIQLNKARKDASFTTNKVQGDDLSETLDIAGTSDMAKNGEYKLWVI